MKIGPAAEYCIYTSDKLNGFKLVCLTLRSQSDWNICF